MEDTIERYRNSTNYRTQYYSRGRGYGGGPLSSSGMYLTNRTNTYKFGTGGLTSQHTYKLRTSLPAKTSFGAWITHPKWNRMQIYVMSSDIDVTALGLSAAPIVLSQHMKVAIDGATRTMKKSFVTSYNNRTNSSRPNTPTTLMWKAMRGFSMKPLFERGRTAKAVQGAKYHIDEVTHKYVRGTFKYEAPLSGDECAFPDQGRLNRNFMYMMATEWGIRDNTASRVFGGNRHHPGAAPRKWFIRAVNQGIRNGTMQMARSWNAAVAEIRESIGNFDAVLPTSLNIVGRSRVNSYDVGRVFAPPTSAYSNIGGFSDAYGAIHGSFTQLNLRNWVSAIGIGQTGTSKSVWLRKTRRGIYNKK